MAQELAGKKVAFLTANEGVEQVELTEPWKAVTEAGGEPVLIAPEEGEVQAFNHLDKGDSFPVNATVDNVDLGDYAGLVLPGGVANPDQLRTKPKAVQLVKDWFAAGKPTAVICHGPWTLVEAGVVNGRTLTSWPSLKTDITNAGGTWVDEEVHRDGMLVTSRNPDDLPAFCAALVDVFLRDLGQLMAGLSRAEQEALPGTLRRSPEKAQETFARTLESAEESYDGDEQAAHRVAYSSLKHSFEKVGDHWESKAGGARGPSDRQAARTGTAKRDRPLPTKEGVDANASKAHLLELARRLDVRGRSRMTKDELVDAIAAANRRATARARPS